MHKHIQNQNFADTDYDRDFNLLYVKVNPTIAVKSGIGKTKEELDPMIVSNLLIYDFETDTQLHFFEKNGQKKILYIFYEREYQKEKKKMLFNHENQHIFNNYELEERTKSDKLFLYCWNSASKAFEFWCSDRKGNQPNMLTSFSEEVSMNWKIDVFNQKIIFIEKLKNEVKVEAFDW